VFKAELIEYLFGDGVKEAFFKIIFEIGYLSPYPKVQVNLVFVLGI